MKNLIMLMILLSSKIVFSQVGINSTNSAPDPSAMLDVSSTEKGMLLPRMSTAQKEAIPSLVEGLMVYDTDFKQFSYWTGSVWVNFGNSVSAGAGWSLSGNNLLNTNSGNIGIGTVSPIGKLDIRSASSYTTPGLTIYDTGPFEYSKIQMQNASSANFWQLDALNNNTDLFNERFLIHNSRLGNIVSVTGDGNVGIGPNNLFPGATLDVARGTAPWGTAAFRGTNTFSYFNYGAEENTYIRAGKTASSVLINDNHNGTVSIASGGGEVGIGRVAGGASLYVEKSALGNATAVFKGTTNNSVINSIGTENTYIRGGKNTSNVIIADVGGSVGIGTSAPDPLYKLSINGTARSKEVIVETGWADYVFENNYNLRSIDEMEKFVLLNKHLPNIPKAEDIQKNGLKVGETNKLMMEKIEELALYIIQLKKEIDILKAK